MSNCLFGLQRNWLCLWSYCCSSMNRKMNWVSFSIMFHLLVFVFVSRDCVQWQSRLRVLKDRQHDIMPNCPVNEQTSTFLMHITAVATLSIASSGISFVEAQHLSIWGANCCHLAISWILDRTVKCCTKLQHVTYCLLQVYYTE